MFTFSLHVLFLQIFADVCNGFGGLSSQVLEELKDEYGNKSFLTFGVTPTQFPDETHKDIAYRILNSALSFSQLSQNSDLFIPLSLASEAWPRTRQAREIPLLTYKVLECYFKNVDKCCNVSLFIFLLVIIELIKN